MFIEKSKVKLSVIIIAKNEEEKIKDCLESVSWADEILVIDSNSTDNTANIAKKIGVKVVNYDGENNFAEVRNKGLKYIHGNWVLYLDCDERIDDNLRREINEIIANSKKSSFAIPRRNIIFGKEFKHCGQWPDYQKRFFYVKNLKGWEGRVHEEPLYDGDLFHCKNPLLHLKEDKIEDMLTKTNEWSEIEAQLMYSAHHPKMNVVRFTSAMIREFYSRMIKQTAFLDGVEGIIYAIYQVYSRFISYAKLWEMQINNMEK